MKKLLLLSFTLIYLNARTQTMYEAEAYSAQKGTTVVATNDPDGGTQDLASMGTSDTATYSITVPSAGIYSLSFRGKGIYSFYVKKGGIKQTSTIAFSDSTAYSTVSTDIKFPAGSQTITLYFNAGFSARLNWFEIDTTSLLLRNTYELESDYDDWVWEVCKDGAIWISDTFARKGENSSRCELMKADTPCIRAELHRGCETDKERWYGFSTYMANGWQSDVLGDIFFQLHEYPDFSLGETWRSPPVGFYTQHDTIYLKGLYSVLAVNTNSNATQYQYNLGKVASNTWVDWVVHVKFAYDNTGILEVWKDGTKIVDRQNLPNSYNDAFNPYPKIGIYKWGWVPQWIGYSPEDRRVIYFDEVRIGTKYSSYLEVSPK